MTPPVERIRTCVVIKKHTEEFGRFGRGKFGKVTGGEKDGNDQHGVFGCDHLLIETRVAKFMFFLNV